MGSPRGVSLWLPNEFSAYEINSAFELQMRAFIECSSKGRKELTSPPLFGITDEEMVSSNKASTVVLVGVTEIDVDALVDVVEYVPFGVTP